MSTEKIPFVDVQIPSESILTAFNPTVDVGINLETGTTIVPSENGFAAANNNPIAQILQQIKPEWNLGSCQIEIFTNGISNKIFCIANCEEKLVFRVFGNGTEQLIDRRLELNNFERLANVGLAAPVYARFRNGLVCGFLQGKCLTIETVREPAVVVKICRAMATMHKIPLEQTACGAAPTAGLDASTFSTKGCQWLSSMPTQFRCAKSQQQFAEYFSGMDLWKQFTHIKIALERINSPMVFSHNDLLIYNILLDEVNDRVHFIDYEYAGPNPQLFDIGNHFCEYAGVDNPDYNRNGPTDEERKRFLKQYFAFFLDSDENDEEKDRLLLSTQLILRDVKHFEAAAHFFWSLWAIHQAHLSHIQFDYMQYAISRHRQFEHLMAQLDIY